ncbi:uncharacterized protein BXIN_2028 [Babesia sp. Xinjiang]|uniref:uncharacterized protein n=1 Tax=Babesia sp. Xinjiang TaxID=462227 RepID=UPI000A245E2C|nr:uncharacterized protein BXIN_2028 [Babesia sp. Xinjiang]ORM40314.1 hypothetical protein BXIN_2028 [Babesia sp. Xinjiang]
MGKQRKAKKILRVTEGLTADSDLSVSATQQTTPFLSDTMHLGTSTEGTDVDETQVQPCLMERVTDEMVSRDISEGFPDREYHVSFRSPIESLSSIKSSDLAESVHEDMGAECYVADNKELVKETDESLSEWTVEEREVSQLLEEGGDVQEIECSRIEIIDVPAVRNEVAENTAEDLANGETGLLSAPVQTAMAPLSEDKDVEVSVNNDGKSGEVGGIMEEQECKMRPYDKIDAQVGSEPPPPVDVSETATLGTRTKDAEGTLMKDDTCHVTLPSTVHTHEKHEAVPNKQESDSNGSDRMLLKEEEGSRTGTIGIGSVYMGVEGSFVIYEKLKNRYDTFSSNKTDRGARISRMDSNSDYKTAVDDDEFSCPDLDYTVIDIPENDVPEKQLESLTEAFKGTVEYMKYREAFRYYNFDYPRCSMWYCIIYSALLVCLISHKVFFDHILERRSGVKELAEWQRIKGNLTYSTGYLDLLFMGLPVILTLMMLKCIGTRYIFAKMACYTWMLLKFFLITSIVHSLSSFTSKNVRDILLWDMGWLLNPHQNIVIGGLYSYNLTFLLYKLLIAGVTIWTLNHRFVVPRLIASMVRRDMQRIRVTSIKHCFIALPNDPVRSERHGTTTALGFAVKIEHHGELPFLWRLLCRAMGDRLMQRESVGRFYQYVGQINKKLKPHGYGAWQSTTPCGETLVGYWEYGIPLGTFRSREAMTHANFSQMLLGWVKCPNAEGITMGISAVETCINGLNFGSLPRVMKYKAEIFDEDNINEGLLKHIGTPGSSVFEDEQNLSQDDKVVLRAYKTAKGVANYDLQKSDAYVQDVKRRSTASERLKCMLSNMSVNRSGSRKLNRMFKFIFKSLERNMPVLVGHEATEIKVSVDTNANLYVDGFVPFDVTFENDMSPIASNTDSTLSLKVEETHMISRRNLLKPVLLRPTVDPVLVPNGWKKRGSYKAPEVFLFIHGPDSSNERQLANVAQLFTTWNYPQYVKPILFGWPPLFNINKLTSAGHERALVGCRDALLGFLRAIVSNGITDVHVVVDSTGVVMFLETFASITQMTDPPCIFRKVGDCTHENATQINLLTVTFMFPQYDLERFISLRYMPLRSHCDVITIFGLKTSDGLCGYLFGTREGMSTNISRFSLKRQNAVLQDTIMYQTDRDEQPTLDSILLPPLAHDVINGNIGESRDISKLWLDVDCIDVTWLIEVKGHRRHENWHLFREIAEDLRELIVSRKRAKDRTTKLDRAKGNVWVYKEYILDHLIESR